MARAMLVYDVLFPDGTVKQFGSHRGVGTVAGQIRMALPTVVAWRCHGEKMDWKELS